jgi:hypothetical protein
VTTGFIKKSFKDPNMYLETYRVTGQAAPTLKTEGCPCFEQSNTEEIRSSSGIDVYIMSIDYKGKVRVDV